MTRTLIGFDYTNTPCVKITKGNFDPKTTPDAEREKFLFSSKWANLVSPISMEVQNFASSPAGLSYQPSGAGPTNFTRARYRFTTSAGVRISYYYRSSRFTDLRYDMPLTAVIWKNPAGRFAGSRVQQSRGGQSGPNGKGGYYATGNAREAGWMNNVQTYLDGNVQATMTYGTAVSCSDNDTQRDVADDTMEKRLIVFNLPGNNVPLDGPTTVPDPAGKLAIQISSTQTRVAKPGFDVRTAAPSQIAFDANNRAIRVIAANDIAIPAGISSFNLGVSIPEEAFALVHFYEGSTITYPGSGYLRQFGADYWFTGTNINFDSTDTCRARFIVLAYDNSPPTSGTNRVFRNFVENGEYVVQFLRPGASANPSFADIVLDSRWPVLQILREGYLNVSSGVSTQTINYDATGFFPFIIYATNHGAGTSNVGGFVQLNFSSRVRMPFVKAVIGLGSLENSYAGDCTYVRYNTSSATFYTYRGRPVDSRWRPSDDAYEFESDDNPITGIRYYVLGIPT
ncbi:MAG: hypothetical protein QHC90_26105 [Shinella sp.]|nr:hypothetical protein [Shinella sp.]